MAQSDKQILKLRARNRVTRQALKYERTTGYRNAGSVLDSISGNLSTTLGGIAGSMSEDNARRLAALQRLSGRTAKAQDRTTERARATVARDYGSAIAGATAPKLKNAEAVAKATGQAMGGQVKAAKGELRSGSIAMGIIQAGTKEAKAAAAAQLAEAFRYRAKDDAHLVAEQQFALAQMRLQAQLEMENFRKQQRILSRTEAEAAGGLGASGMTAVADKASTFFSGLQQVFNTESEALGGRLPNAAEAAALYAQEFGIAPESPEYAVLQSIATAMYQNGAGSAPGQLYGPGTSSEMRQEMLTNAVLNTLAQLYPQYEKHEDKLRRTILSGISSSNAIASYEALLTALGPTVSNSGNPAASAGTHWAQQVGSIPGA